MKDIVERIAENASTEFENFKNNELLKDKEDVFRDCYTIHFYTEVYEFLNGESSIQRFPKEDLELIEKEGTSFICLLYDYYLCKEYASISSWDDIDNMIRWYCNKYKGQGDF